MKRLLSAVLTLLLALMLIPSALADVIADPNPDIFNGPYDPDDVEYIGEYYYANSANGRVYSKQYPSSALNLMSFPNGVTVYIDYSWIYEDEEWGYIGAYTENGEDTVYDGYGWVKMTDLAPVYANQSFMADHAEEIVPFEQSAASLKDTKFYLWSYPGSGSYIDTYMVYPLDDPSEIEFNLAYTDPDGREWGYVSYFYGKSDAWVCLTDPTNPGIPAFAKVEAELYPSKGGPVKSESLLSTGPIVIGLVALVAIITVALILVLGRRNRSKPSEAPPTAMR